MQVKTERKTVEPKNGNAQQITSTHEVSPNSSAFLLDIGRSRTTAQTKNEAA